MTAGDIRVETKTPAINEKLRVDLLNILPAIFMILSGLIMQFHYHLHNLPDEASALGLDRQDWRVLHIASAIVAAAGCIVHISQHKKHIGRLVKSRAMSGWLFIVFILSAGTGLISWLRLSSADSVINNASDHARFMWIEMHDKFGIALAVLVIMHMVRHRQTIISAIMRILIKTPRKQNNR